MRKNSLKIICFVFIYLPSIFGLAQRINSVMPITLNTIDSSYFFVARNTSGFYMPLKVDNNFFELRKDNELIKLYNNGQLLDTLKESKYEVNLNSIRNVYVSNGELFLIGMYRINLDNSTQYAVYRYSFLRKEFIKLIDSCNFVFGLFNQNLVMLSNEKSIKLFDIKTLKEIPLLDLSAKFCKDCSIANISHFKDTNNLLIYSGKNRGDHYENDQYFIFNMVSKKLLEVTESLTPICVQKLNEWNEYDYYIDENFSRPYSGLIKIHRPDCIEHSESFLVDENSNVRLDLLERVSTVKGLIYKTNDVVGYFLTTRGDDRKDVLITETPSIVLETMFSKIFNNKIILESDLEQLSDYYIDLLEKFIYAKHNLKFDQEYYQYYFNTFSFYADPIMRKSRKSEVRDLLTEADFKNLLLLSKY